MKIVANKRECCTFPSSLSIVKCKCMKGVWNRWQQNRVEKGLAEQQWVAGCQQWAHARTPKEGGRRENLAGAARSEGEEKSRHNDVWPPNWLPDSNRLWPRAWWIELSQRAHMQIYAAAAHTFKAFSARGEKATHPVPGRHLGSSIGPFDCALCALYQQQQRLYWFCAALNSKCARTLFGACVREYGPLRLVCKRKNYDRCLLFMQPRSQCIHPVVLKQTAH